MVRCLVASLLLLAAPACARVPDTVTPADLRAHIAVLADDGFAGRKPGTEGGAKTEAYVEDAFAHAGLIPGASDGGWRQAVPLVERPPAQGTLRFRTATGAVTIPADGYALLTAVPRVDLKDAPVWFVGNGAFAALDRIDLTGAVVIATLEKPEPEGRRGLDERAADFARRGVAAILYVSADPWPATRERFAALRGRPLRLATGRVPEAVVSEAALTPAMALATAPKGALLGADSVPVHLGLTADLAFTVTPRAFTPANIIGRVAGSDPAAGAVVLTAHWDHLGLCRPEGVADRICNGANDNASGVAMLIEVARRIAAGPRPVRDVYFVATTAEEMGLLGARAFAAAPPVPLARIVAALNLDTAAIMGKGAPVAILGRGRTPALDRAVDDTVRRLKRRVDGDDEAAVMLQRQDGWALAEAGVPAIMVGGSFSDMKRLRAYLSGNYHGPADDLDHLGDLSGAAEDATLHVALVRALADPTPYPSPR